MQQGITRTKSSEPPWHLLALPFLLLNHVQLFAISWTIVCQAPLSMEFSRQEYWSGLPFPSPGDLPTQRLNPGILHWQADSLSLSHQGSPGHIYTHICPFFFRFFSYICNNIYRNIYIYIYIYTHTHTEYGVAFPVE